MPVIKKLHDNLCLVRNPHPRADDPRRAGFLNREQELKLVYHVKAGGPLAGKAKDTLTNKLEYLVNLIAKQYLWMGLDFSDLQQAGKAGLLDALDRFDPSRGKRLSTYSSFWIRNYIQRAISENEKKMRQLSSSLEATVAREKSEGYSILTRLATSQPSAEDLVIARSDISWLRNVLPALPPYQKRVIELIYGLSMDYGDREMDNKEVGRIVGLSRERVRQIKDEVLEKLQKIASKPNHPEPYLKWKNDPNILNFMLAALFPEERELYEMTFDDWVSDHKAAELLGKTEKEIMAERKKLKQELDERYASILRTQEQKPETSEERILAQVA